MKRILAAIIAAMLLVCGAACAEAPEDAGVFEIRNGVRWGMSQKQIKAIEGDPGEYSDYEMGRGVWRLDYDLEQHKSVSLFPCEISFMFTGDRLYMIRYMPEFNWYALDDIGQYAYLNNALTSLYGEGREPEGDDLLWLYTAMHPDAETDLITTEEYTRVRMWDLPQGTTAVLCYDYNRIMLVYYRYDELVNLLPEDGVYNTDGL